MRDHIVCMRRDTGVARDVILLLNLCSVDHDQNILDLSHEHSTPITIINSNNFSHGKSILIKN